MSYQGSDPDEVDRAAHVLAQSREQIQQQAKRVRASIHGISRFHGGAADKARAQVDEVAKRLDKDARDLDELVRSLKAIAAQARVLNR